MRSLGIVWLAIGLSLCSAHIAHAARGPVVTGAGFTLSETSCEYAANPLGVEASQPRFSWILQSDERGQMQSACQILVASTQEKLAADGGDKWDSGKIATEQSVNVAYQGGPLMSGERCHWKVRCWDQKDRVSAWSRPAWFEMGLLKPDDWKGQWIGMETKGSFHRPGEAPAPMLRRTFQIAKPLKRARAYVSGIGWSEMHVNGRKVGDRVLDPPITDYAKRVLYVTHDITDQLVPGANSVGIMLGNGWYSNRKHFTEFGKWGDSPRLLVQINIEFADGSTMSVVSDKDWKVSTGPILRNDLYGGEIYDARLEKPGWTTAAYNDSGWQRAAIKEPPGGTLESQLMPAIQTIQTMKPAKLANPKPGVHVYDLGQVFAGWAKLWVKGPAGTTVTIKYSERVRKDSGLLDQKIFCYPGLQFSAIAPQYSIHVFDAAFGGIYPVLVWYLHQYYGDDQILAEHYAGMKKWVDYVTSLAPGHILSQGTYGDHMEPGESPGQEGFISKESPPPLIWTAYYYLDVSVIAKVANLLGKKEDARHYATLADEIKEAFNQKWFNPKLSRYATGTQTCNLIPLAIGLVPEAHQSSVVNNVVTDIVEKHRGRFHAGDIGAVCMVDMLPEHGQGDLLYKIATATTCPGWGYMVQQGATTIWESWGRSWPHSDRERHESMIMLSFIEKFFYEDLAGLRGPAFHATRSMPPGYRQVVIQPRVLGDLSRASASIKTVRGTVSSSWQRSGNAIRRDVAIPVNSEAKVSMPKLGLNNVRVEEGADKAATDLQKAVGK